MEQLKKHLSFKILTNLLKIPINLGLNAIFPRLLGPSGYGNFEFLQDTASKIIGFFDTGTSIAFYTRLSQDHSDSKLIKFYWYVVLLLVLIYIVFVSGTLLTGFCERIWPDQDYRLIAFSTILGIVTFISSTLVLITDAANLTVNAEKVRMAHMVVSIILFVAVIQMFGTVDLSTFYYLQISLALLLICGCYFILNQSHIEIFPKEKLSLADCRPFFQYFWKFSNPLLVYSFVALLTGVGARWILQHYGGSVQQGYFGLSTKIGGFVLLFSSALMPLIMREFAKLSATGNSEGLSKLYVHSFKGLYYISMFIAVFVFFNARTITNFLGGLEFQEAKEVLSIMAFFPVHQSLGQINGSFFYSTNRNIAHRNIGLFFMPLSLVVSFWFIAPHASYGLNLGAIGLAFQMLVIQMVTVNVASYVNSQFLKITYLTLLGYQIIVFGVFFLTGWLSDRIGGMIMDDGMWKIVLFLTIFGTLILLLTFIFPALSGFRSRSELFALNPLRKKNND